MARVTIMEKDGGQQVTITTDDSGTDVVDENSGALTHYGYDRHDETVEEYKRGGWVIISQTG